LLTVLDALIGLGATVQAKEAHKLYPEFAAQSVILLFSVTRRCSSQRCWTFFRTRRQTGARRLQRFAQESAAGICLGPAEQVN
jgi:hypothetical protein